MGHALQQKCDIGRIVNLKVSQYLSIRVTRNNKKGLRPFQSVKNVLKHNLRQKLSQENFFQIQLFSFL